jgi:hypothetical protein
MLLRFHDFPDSAGGLWDALRGQLSRSCGCSVSFVVPYCCGVTRLELSQPRSRCRCRPPRIWKLPFLATS